MNRLTTFQVHQMYTHPLRSLDWGVQQELYARLDTSRFVPFRRATRITLMEIQ